MLLLLPGWEHLPAPWLGGGWKGQSLVLVVAWDSSVVPPGLGRGAWRSVSKHWADAEQGQGFGGVLHLSSGKNLLAYCQDCLCVIWLFLASSVLISICLQAGSFHIAGLSQSKSCSQSRAAGCCPFLPSSSFTVLGALWFVPAAGTSPTRGRKRYLCSKTVLSLAAGAHSTKEVAAVPFPDVTLHGDTVAYWVQPERALILVSPSSRLLHPVLQKTLC